MKPINTLCGKSAGMKWQEGGENHIMIMFTIATLLFAKYWDDLGRNRRGGQVAGMGI
jgi:hypothetical protein